MLLPWSTIETVFLDMDGTLLDLHFDNYFWQEYLPNCYAKKKGLPLPLAQRELAPLFSEQKGCLNWYCIDYWTHVLDLPVLQHKQEVAHLIAWRKNAAFFLEQLKKQRKTVVLITNAHQQSLSLKLQKIGFAKWFSQMISSHEFGYPKEQPEFWSKLQEVVHFNPATSLFIDDSISILRSAKRFGIAHLCAIAQPDSQQPPLDVQHEFLVIEDYADCF